MEDPIIDFHTHLPWRPRDPLEASRALLEAMDHAGVTLAVTINVEFAIRTFLENVSPRRVVEAAAEALDYLIVARVSYIHKMVMEPEWAVEEHVRFMRENHRDNVDFVRVASTGRLIPVASFNPDLSIRENLDRLKALGDRVLGVKVFPTLHFTRPDSEKLRPVYDYVAGINGVVVVHTGCDPGIWELPSFCSNARPSYVARAARENEDVRFIVAHLGAYSALNPGIFFREALEALTLDNVYADTSAVDPYFVRRAVEEVGYDKILFGSDYPMVQGLDIASALEDIMMLDIPWRAKRAMITDNPLKLLRTWHGWERVGALRPGEVTGYAGDRVHLGDPTG
ncbi:MAG: amidohydrolase family protein [Acidilobaceae archaeon]